MSVKFRTRLLTWGHFQSHSTYLANDYHYHSTRFLIGLSHVHMCELAADHSRMGHQESIDSKTIAVLR